MKKILLCLLFITLSPLFAQNDSITIGKPNLSVISSNKLNFVYRSIINPISVGINSAKSFKISGKDIINTEDGKYAIKPKAGKETKILVEIETSDSTKVFEEHIFRIKDLPYAALLVNKKGCINGDCTIDILKKDLLNAEISVKLIDFLLDYNITVTGFRLYLTNPTGETIESFEIQGNKIPQDVYDAIISNEKATLINIHKLTFTSDFGLSMAKTPMIKIRKI